MPPLLPPLASGSGHGAGTGGAVAARASARASPRLGSSGLGGPSVFGGGPLHRRRLPPRAGAADDGVSAASSAAAAAASGGHSSTLTPVQCSAILGHLRVTNVTAPAMDYDKQYFLDQVRQSHDIRFWKQQAARLTRLAPMQISALTTREAFNACVAAMPAGFC